MFNVLKFTIFGDDQKQQDHLIRKNDVLKIGRIKFKVIDVKI